MAKDDGAFLTIGELAQQLGIAQHILRYWETRFPQLRPLQRSGNRRYYRPGDVEIARQINRLLHQEGFTVRGAQRVLAGRKDGAVDAGPAQPLPEDVSEPAAIPPSAAVNAVRRQGELPIGDAPVVSAGSDAGKAQKVASSDLALLIARLTVIRQNLLEALEPTD
jgi:DNA-binding transcriptional MerR regulator